MWGKKQGSHIEDHHMIPKYKTWKTWTRVKEMVRAGVCQKIELRGLTDGLDWGGGWGGSLEIKTDIFVFGRNKC